MKNPPCLHRSVAIPAPPRLRWVWGSRKAVTAVTAVTGKCQGSEKCGDSWHESCYEVSCPEKSEQFWGEPLKKPSRAKGEDWLTEIMTSAKWSLNMNRNFRFSEHFSFPDARRVWKIIFSSKYIRPSGWSDECLDFFCGFFQPNGCLVIGGGPHSDMVRSSHPTLWWRIWITIDHHGSPCLYAIDIH